MLLLILVCHASALIGCQLLTILCLFAVPPKSNATPSKVAGAVRTSSRRSLGSAWQSSASTVPPNKRARTSKSPLGQPCSQQPHRQDHTQPLLSDVKPSQAQGVPKQPQATAEGQGREQGPGAVQASSQMVNGPTVAVQDKEDNEKPLQEANYTWVQCDLCNKWRELPKGHAVSDSPASMLSPVPVWHHKCKCGPISTVAMSPVKVSGVISNTTTSPVQAWSPMEMVIQQCQCDITAERG